MNSNSLSNATVSSGQEWLAAAAVAGTLIFVNCFSSAQAANLLSNGDFEGGEYTSGANSAVPDGWTPNAIFDAEAGGNLLTYHGRSACCFAESGTNFLYIGSETIGSPSMLSQTFSDTAGQDYTVSFWAYDMGWNGPADSGTDFFNVSVSGAVDPGITLSNDANTDYGNYTFAFVGSGSDTLTISAQNNYGAWVTDNYSISAATGGTPEPSTWAMIALGFAGLGLAGYRTSRKAISIAD